MALNVPSYKSAYSNSPIENAYGWMSQITVDFRRKIGDFKIDVHPHIEDWENDPIGQVNISLGSSSGGKTIKTLDELMKIKEFRESFFVIAGILYEESLKHPALKNANITELVG